MSTERTVITRWLRRARPGRRALARALGTGLLASVINVALVIGAAGLLVASAARPGLRAVAVVLVVVELFAFLRSPLRFAERMTAHRLGYDAVTHWRQWLVRAVGALDYARWRTLSTGDLLERALDDTDELQLLWLRFAVPVASALATLALADVVAALVPPRGSWWPFLIALVAAQVLGVAALVVLGGRSLELERARRKARGHYRARLVELSAAAPELALLDGGRAVNARLERAARHLELAEDARRRARRGSNVVVLAAGALTLGAFASHPTSAPLWLVVNVLIAFATFESLGVVRGAIDAAVDVSGGAERLDELAPPSARATATVPTDATFSLEDVSITIDGRDVVRGATLRVAAGQHVAVTGHSGAGKSSLLRTLAGLELPSRGRVLVGGLDARELREDQLHEVIGYGAEAPTLTRGYALDVVLLGRATKRDPLADLASLGLTATPSTHFDTLSRGEVQRVAVVRALVSGPSLVVLDEPTSGLGEDETDRVLALLESTGAAVVIATHDARVVEWCDHVLTLDGAARDEEQP